jgi:hypothetical protein
VTSLRETAGGDAAPEARANHHIVIPFVHHRPPLSIKPRIAAAGAHPTNTDRAMTVRNPSAFRVFSTLDTASY